MRRVRINHFLNRPIFRNYPTYADGIDIMSTSKYVDLKEVVVQIEQAGQHLELYIQSDSTGCDEKFFYPNGGPALRAYKSNISGRRGRPYAR